eukprot:460325-Prymnesium_polylepis.1
MAGEPAALPPTVMGELDVFCCGGSCTHGALAGRSAAVAEWLSIRRRLPPRLQPVRCSPVAAAQAVVASSAEASFAVAYSAVASPAAARRRPGALVGDGGAGGHDRQRSLGSAGLAALGAV